MLSFSRNEFSSHIARRRYGLGYLIFKISELQRELAKLKKYSLYLIGFSKKLASHFDRSLHAICGLALTSGSTGTTNNPATLSNNTTISNTGVRSE